ncbi:MAG: InlB B-repeat-containing protein, partial [Alphaproteobacteria bacterium]|nr:InlB B-repeat-containing protein [Alphaproteobacteria bacterium]
SNAGSTSKSQCTKSCSVECKQNACSTQDANAAACSYGANTATGTQPQNGTCDAVQKACPITVTKCNANYWLENGKCNACDSGYTSNAGSTSKSQCTKSCSITCKQNACSTQDANAAACSYGANDATGTQSQGGSCDATQKACPITVTKCNANYLLKNGACTSCPEHATCDGTGDWVCDTNYKKTTTGCVLGIFECKSGYESDKTTPCKEGHYCPGGTVDAGTEATACSPSCPEDTSDGTVSSVTGATQITQCKTVRKGVELDENSGLGDETCGWDTYAEKYSANCVTKVTRCYAGYFQEDTAAPICVLTHIKYYSPDPDLEQSACSALSGADDTVTTAGRGAKTATDCFNTCTDIVIGNGIRKPVNATESYNGTNIPACSYTTTCDTGYQASGTTCVPKVLAITLNHNGAETYPTSPIYLKYNTGWYSDNTANNQIESVIKPTIDGETFGGYLSASDDIVVDANGKLTTDYKVFSTNATITASWDENEPITCVAGTYYDGAAQSCRDCTAGNYCEGVTTRQDSVKDAGLKTCVSLGGTYTAASGKTVSISSVAKAKTASDCFATNIEYKTNYATGTQTCYYATGRYNSACTNKKVLTCVAGYYLENTTDADCVEVGKKYYSAAIETERHQCPEFDNEDVSTAGSVSASVTECFKGNIWEFKNNSGYRKKCYHKDDATAPNGYDANCEELNLVACEGGYYDDGKTVDAKGYRMCVAVGKDFWSPGITSGQEPEVHNNNPTTQRNQCPDGTSTESVTTASSESQCIGQREACVVGKSYANKTHTTCAMPYYCPGVGDVPVNVSGCFVTCPTGKITSGAGETRKAGADKITDCWKSFKDTDHSDFAVEHGAATLQCSFNTEYNEYIDCEKTVTACDAGYYNPAGTLICSDVDNGSYSAAGDLLKHDCPTKVNYTVGSDGTRAANTNCFISCASYIPTVEHAKNVSVQGDTKKYFDGADYAACEYAVECETGYSPVNGTSPKCNPKSYTVTLDKNGGSGNVAESVQCTFDSGACALPDNSGLTKSGYKVVAKWCTNADGTGVCFDAGSTVKTNLSANATDIVLYAVWTPGVFKITLSAPDATENATQAPVYLKYATGWYSDANATNPITNIGTKLPVRDGESYVFVGYKIGDIYIINSNGVLQQSVLTIATDDTTATAVWDKGVTTCAAGTYYSGSGSICLPCEKHNFCIGGKFVTDDGTAGLSACPNDGLSAGGTSATNIGVCYKENLSFVSKTQKATGTQTCSYGTIAYDANCRDIVIKTCIAGYWYDKTQSTIDCVQVGENYYSTDGDLTRELCPSGGNTNGKTEAAAITECSKRVDTYKSNTDRALGSWVCMADTNGNYVRACNLGSVIVTWCEGGYWFDTTQSTQDCVEVGEDHYSATGDLNKSACPYDGKTSEKTASTPHGVCRKTVIYPASNYSGPAVHGNGTQGCLYDAALDDYLLNCSDINLTKCDNGYYWASKQNKVCSVVDFGYYGPVADINNGDNQTARAACPDNGLTKTQTSDAVSDCFKENLACAIQNGRGETTCNFDNTKLEYSANCATCIVTECDFGYWLNENKCVNCEENHVCINGEKHSCTSLTNGTHPNSDAGTTDAAYCCRDCDLAVNAFAMRGRDFYKAVDTCEITTCNAGYTLSNGKCALCPEGFICTPDNPNPQSCATLTNGEHTLSELGSDSKDDCFKKCESFDVEYGVSVPAKDIVYSPEQCEYTCISITGNPGDIVKGVCVENSCNFNFEMINGKCQPCNREHAISYKEKGNCIVDSCVTGYHPNGQSCEDNVIECSAPNAIAATQTWNRKNNAFGGCIITECAVGYHLGANSCQADEQVCEVPHGAGIREWDHTKNTWGDCIATRCDPGYTNDRGLTNELWAQCGRCSNMYAENGEVAVSGYVQECEIAACMYQGQKYTLVNNECVFICPTIDAEDDGTGSQFWSEKEKKCVRTCEPGYMQW